MKKNKVKYYNEGDVIRIINTRQAALYWGKYGIEPISVYPSKDYKTGEDIIAFTFSKSETQEAYKEWLNARKEV